MTALDILGSLLPQLLPAVVAGAAAYVAVRVELAVMKTRVEMLAANAERERARLDSMFRMKTGGAPLGPR